MIKETWEVLLSWVEKKARQTQNSPLDRACFFFSPVFFETKEDRELDAGADAGTFSI